MLPSYSIPQNNIGKHLQHNKVGLYGIVVWQLGWGVDVIITNWTWHTPIVEALVPFIDNYNIFMPTASKHNWFILSVMLDRSIWKHEGPVVQVHKYKSVHPIRDNFELFAIISLILNQKLLFISKPLIYHRSNYLSTENVTAR